jgi:phage baseplate assembly protein W
MALFAGFSTKNKKAINHVLTDKDLVVEDLMNHIMTRKGERVMLPNYGSIIHDMIFEPLTSETTELIEVSDSDHTVNAIVRLEILPSKEPVELIIDLERE